jgi:hypothetical protein
MERFPPQGFLEAVGHESGQLPAEAKRPFAEQSVKVHGPINDGGGRFLPAHNFYQGNEVGGIEGVADHDTVWIGTFGL